MKNHVPNNLRRFHTDESDKTKLGKEISVLRIYETEEIDDVEIRYFD